jgi:tRNA pseudouridine38-40 synthase
MSQRVKLIVAYDGGAFAGWQSQTHRNTIQDKLERALCKIIGEEVRVHGAGRTDAGVHALAQCAHVDLPAEKLDSFNASALQKALNANLPPSIRVLRCQWTSDKFHARYSAKGKLYRYRIHCGPILPPLELGRAWHIPAALDMDRLKAAGKKFEGEHDFAAFAANRGKKEENSTRTIWSVKVRRTGTTLTIDFSGDGFLYKMVRLMVGAMTQVGRGKMEPSEIETRLRVSQPNGFRLVAPAEGLYLVKVWY